MIISLENKKIKLLNKLKQKKYRLQEQQFFVEGEHLVEMALQYGDVVCVLLTEQYEIDYAKNIYHGEKHIGYLNTAYEYISLEVANKIKETVTSQGIFAICKMKASQFDGQSIVVFDGLQDPGNVGTIIRTAQAFGITNFYFTKDCVDVYNDKVIRASQGAVFLSNLFVSERLETMLTANHQVLVADLHGTDIQDFQLIEKKYYALIVGNEANGINEANWQSFPLTKITIPMQKTTESLNVAIATGIILYELA